MVGLTPEDYHPDLKAERLVIIANLLAAIRREALEDYDPARGDGPWSHGCRVYERSCNALEQAAKEYRWLSCTRDGLYFLFYIGRVPMRFYRDSGDPESPPVHRLRQEHPEVTQLQTAFGFAEHEEHPAYRMVFETDDTGDVSRVLLVRARPNGEILNCWVISIAGGPVRAIAHTDLREDPYEPEKPSVGLPLGSSNAADAEK